MRRFFASFVISLTLSGASFAKADEVYTFVVKKQEEKKSTRWNLTDWLATRDRMRIQDLWLAKNLPTPYEFYLGGDYRFLSDPKDERDYRLVFAAYAKRFGLSVEKESEPGRLNALLHFRLLGAHNQSTNLTFHGGMRAQSDPATFRSGVAGVSLTLYLTKYFGVEGLFRHYFRATPNSAGGSFSGNQTEANAFIDFGFLRIYGGILKQPIDAERKSGYHLGTRLFF